VNLKKNGCAQGEDSNDGACAEIVRPCRQVAFAAVAEFIGAETVISYEDKKGRRHDERSADEDRPETDVKG
jgi:hypothetical protein